MVRDQFIPGLDDELIFDNFAGGGGASTGIYMALGRHVDHAANHDPLALGMHRINHPQTIHHCEDIFDVDPARLAGNRRIGFGWFSPDCKHFSKAKGGKPLDKRIRGLVLVMLKYAKVRTRVMSMENVVEIQTWGPLLHHPRHKKDCDCLAPCGRPDPKHKGRTWRAFLDALSVGVDPNHPDLPEMLNMLGGAVTQAELVRGFGYDFQAREIVAYTVGAATIRKRLYMIARCDGRPIVWPQQTHADPEQNLVGMKPYKIIAECIDWDRPCPSIFLTKAQARKWKCRRPLKTPTMRRVATGVGRYVMHSKRPFIVSLTHQGGERIESIDEPSKTLTAAHRGEKALVNARIAAPHIMRHFGESVGQEVTAPAPTTMPNGGGKTALVSGTLVRTAHGDQDKNGKKRGRGDHSLAEPMPAQMASKEFALAQTVLAPLVTEHAHSTDPRNHPVDKPSMTQCAGVKGGHFALVAGTLVQTGYGEREGQAPRVPGVQKPIGTIVPGGKHAVVAAHLTKFNTGSVGSPLDKPAPTIPACNHSPDTHGGAATPHGLVAASMVKLRGDPETHQVPGQPMTDPVNAISAGGQHHAVSCAYLAQHNAGNNTNPGHPATEPASTISGKGSQQQLVSASIAAYYGTEKDGQAMDEPLRVATAKARFGLAMSEAVSRGLTEEQYLGAVRVAKFLRKFGVQFEGELACVGDFVIIDIGMRMLAPRELFRAQGFPEQYVIDRAWLVNPKTGELVEVVLTKESQIRMCGNSVCPDVAAAITAANVPELAAWSKSEVRCRTGDRTHETNRTNAASCNAR